MSACQCDYRFYNTPIHLSDFSFTNRYVKVAPILKVNLHMPAAAIGVR